MNNEPIPHPPMMHCACDAILLGDIESLREFIRSGVLTPPDPLDDLCERMQTNEPYAIYSDTLCAYIDRDYFADDFPMCLAALIGRHDLIQMMHDELGINLPDELYMLASRNNHFDTFRFIVEYMQSFDYEEVSEDFERHQNHEAIEYLTWHQGCGKNIKGH